MNKTLLLITLFGLGASLTLVAQDSSSNQDSSTPQPNLDRSQLPTPPSVEAPKDPDTARDDTAMHHETLVAVLRPTEGNQARGVVVFESRGDEGVQVTANITGLEPGSTHAIHIHEFGDTSAPDGSSAGSHFNPAGSQHGLPVDEEHHAGDFGNLEADEKGNAMKTLTIPALTLSGDANAVIGRAVIIHEGEDKGTQPTGDAGGRIAQGVIAVANPGAMPDQGEPVKAGSKEANTASDPASTRVVVASQPDNPGATDEIEEAAEQIGRGAEKAARTTARVIERGAEEVGAALKDVGREVKKAVQ